MRPQFDNHAFFTALDSLRHQRRLTWRQVGRELELSPSTFSRLARGRNPDVDTLMTLLDWMGSNADSFIVGRRKGGSGDAMARVADALRSDPTLRPEDVQPLEDIVRVAYTRFRLRKP
jgi:transcriptional regulator with XRE-family HTH domain